MCKVSVIIPVYKSVNVIENAIKSVTDQSLQDFEIILVDDGSPDESLQLCRNLAKKDARIKVFHKENGGICSARNYGMKQVKGEYTAFLDHDDKYLPGYLEDNIALLDTYKADVVKFERVRNHICVNGEVNRTVGERIKNMPGIKDGMVCYREEEIAEHFSDIRQASKVMYMWDAIYRTSFLRENHITFDESFKSGHEDVMFNLDVLSAAKLMIFNSKAYYQHNYSDVNSTSATLDLVRIKDAARAANREMKLLSQWNYPEADKMLSCMNEFYIVLTILNLPGEGCSTKDKVKAMEEYIEETYVNIHSPKKAIRDLFQRQKMHGILAWLAYHKLNRVCLWLFAVYNIFYNRSAK